MKRTIFSLLFAMSAAVLASPIRSMLGANGVEDAKGESIPLPDGVVAVEYIESTDGQYIDTGLNSSADGFCDFEISFRCVGSFFYMPFGYQYGASARYALWAGTSTSDHMFYVGVDYANYITVKKDNEWHEIKLFNGDRIVIDNISTPIGVGSIRENIGLFLFATINSPRGASSYVPCNADIAYVRIYDVNGQLLRDYIPVRALVDDEWVGAMYDFVTEELYFNAGSGSFIIGPDL